MPKVTDLSAHCGTCSPGLSSLVGAQSIFVKWKICIFYLASFADSSLHCLPAHRGILINTYCSWGANYMVGWKICFLFLWCTKMQPTRLNVPRVLKSIWTFSQECGVGGGVNFYTWTDSMRPGQPYSEGPCPQFHTLFPPLWKSE